MKFLKNWSIKLTKLFGKNYSYTNLSRFRQFYREFPKIATLWQVSWSHIKLIIPFKDENKRNYYLNQTIVNHLSVRELKKQISEQSFERLSYKDKENIQLIDTNNYHLTIEDMIKDPILLKTNKNVSKLDEKVIHKYIIELLENKFLELGIGFALIGHEYKFYIENKTYKIDLLFFNYELNSFVVVEVKTRELQPSDIGQLEFYVNYVEKNIKKINHNKTIGMLVVKKKNHYVIEYTTINNMYFTTYELI